mmetsp:Transcript_68725/g.191720  ORF Transcript_68725/g.191720 Transcript_68725/m.191720 type:complete len:433 (-) Transcript_68725:117-1415(-)
MNANIDLETKEELADTWIMQAAIKFVWTRGAIWIFYADFIIVASLTFLMTWRVYRTDGVSVGGTVVCWVFIVFLTIRQLQMVYQLRRHEMVTRRLIHLPMYRQFLRGPLVFCGLSRSLRSDPWNICVWFLIVSTFQALAIYPKQSHGVWEATLLLAYHCTTLGKLTNANEKYATFLFMVKNICEDVLVFIGVMGLLFLVFAHFFMMCFQNAYNDDQIDDGDAFETDYDWTNIHGAFINTFLLGLGFEGPWILPTTTNLHWNIEIFGMAVGDTAIFVIYLVFLQISFITLLNILVAIVCDSYDDAINRSDKTYWVQRMDLCAETSLVYRVGTYADGGCFPSCLVKNNNKLKENIDKYMTKNLGKKSRKWKGKMAAMAHMLTKDSEQKTRRLMRELKEMRQEVAQQFANLEKEESESFNFLQQIVQPKDTAASE